MTDGPALKGGRPTAPFGRRRCEVAGVDQIGAYTVLRVADPIGPMPDPGQFSMLSTVERWGGGDDERPHLPRAFSVMRWRDTEASYLLEAVGPGTERLCALAPGDAVWVVGPLGQGFAPVDDGRLPVLVGGGVGIAPLAAWQDVLDAQVAEHALLLGFRDAAHAAGAQLLRDPRIATDDGAIGHHGRVTELLAGVLDAAPEATVYACGPPRMLEAVRSLCAQRRVPAELALEAGMACGFGACYGCVVELADGSYARVCVDGPVFAGRDLAEIGAHG